MSKIDEIMEKVNKINIHSQVIVDSILECDTSDETLQALVDVDLYDALVSGAGSLIVAVNLAQTLAIEPEDFDTLIDRLEVGSNDECVKRMQSSLFARLTELAEEEYISKGVLPSVLERRLRKIESVIH